MNRTVLLLLAASTLALAQSSNGGWRRVGDTPPPAPQAQQQPVGPAAKPEPVGPTADPEPIDRSDAYGQPVAQQQPPPQQPQPDFAPSQTPPIQTQRNDRPQMASRPAYGLPPEVTVKPGTYLTVHINQMLSSDHNQPGDTFIGSLAQPLVVDGIVVANRNQLVYGRVAEAQRAHSNSPSRLGLELTSVTLADGGQVPIHSQLAARQGGTTPVGDQVGTVAMTTIGGAAVGGIAARGTGAAVGAGVGAMAGIIGVMLTRNQPTVIHPEQVLTFAVTTPLVVSTMNAPHAFRYVGPEDYNQPVRAGVQPRPRAVAPYPAYGPYAYPAPYPYYGYPGYYGGVSVVVGSGWGWGRYGYGYGRRGRWW
jgi:hypothetical protein